MRRRPAPLPLSGITVIDFSRVLAGPLATQMLGDAGARVIKVEEPGRGDETRRWGPPFVRGVSAYFLAVNRNKESVTLNLRAPEGREVAAGLIDRADVVIDNFLPSQRRAFGLQKLPRRIIHCSITGFDPDSPDAATPGYDLLAQAGAGLMAITGDPEGAPMKVGVALADVLTAHYATSSILAALFARERTGRGARIELSLFGSTIASLVNVAQSALVSGKEARRHGNAHPSIVPYQLFHGRDRPFVVAAGTDRHFQALSQEVLGMPELAADARFATNAARVENRDELLPALEKAFAGRPASFWVKRCRRAGVPAALVQGVREALQSASGRLLLAEIDSPEAGPILSVASPVIIDGGRLPVRRSPPALGQHTSAVLREIGLPRRYVDELRRGGVI
jgi:crotonobetainyl-CoA:carnitine CoA-transferase CaiB-like acyl-CoA transferase